MKVEGKAGRVETKSHVKKEFQGGKRNLLLLWLMSGPEK